MKYLSVIVGAAWLIYLLTRQTVRVFGISCRVISMDSTGYGGDPVCMSDAGFSVGIILGLALLVIGGFFIAKDYVNSNAGSRTSYRSGGSSQYSFSFASDDDDRGSIQQKTTTAPTVAPDKFDKKKWQVLKGVDPDIAAASAEVSAMAPELDDVLAERYLVLNDKTYLSALVSTIVKENAERIEAERLAKEKAQAAMSEQQKAQMEARIARSQATIEEIKNNGMFNTRNRKRVVSAEMYFGSESYNHGYAKIVYEDGTAELRSGDSWGACTADLD